MPTPFLRCCYEITYNSSGFFTTQHIHTGIIPDTQTGIVSQSRFHLLLIPNSSTRFLRMKRTFYNFIDNSGLDWLDNFNYGDYCLVSLVSSLHQNHLHRRTFGNKFYENLERRLLCFRCSFRPRLNVNCFK